MLSTDDEGDDDDDDGVEVKLSELVFVGKLAVLLVELKLLPLLMLSTLSPLPVDPVSSVDLLVANSGAIFTGALVTPETGII